MSQGRSKKKSSNKDMIEDAVVVEKVTEKAYDVPLDEESAQVRVPGSVMKMEIPKDAEEPVKPEQEPPEPIIINEVLSVIVDEPVTAQASDVIEPVEDLPILYNEDVEIFAPDDAPVTQLLSECMPAEEKDREESSCGIRGIAATRESPIETGATLIAKSIDRLTDSLDRILPEMMLNNRLALQEQLQVMNNKPRQRDAVKRVLQLVSNADLMEILKEE